jgi:hypothetical protein
MKFETVSLSVRAMWSKGGPAASVGWLGKNFIKQKVKDNNLFLCFHTHILEELGAVLLDLCCDEVQAKICYLLWC